MSQSRRSFLSLATSGAAAAVLATSARGLSAAAEHGKGKRVLIIGGTGFVGPAIVEAAGRRGVGVTLFNRGKTNPGLFPHIEQIHGDRNSDVATLQAAFQGRAFDAVIDTSGYFPRQVRVMAAALHGAVPRYVFISSVSVYKDMSKPLDEGSPLSTVSDPDVEKISEGRYGGLKALSERAAEEALPGGALIIRPGYIVGPRDPTDRFTSWPLRVRRGGEMVAPGSESDPVQFIDVRDLADWIITMVMSGGVGIYNAVGPRGTLTMGELLRTCKQVVKSDARPVWVSAELLKKAGVSDSVPIWVSPDNIGMRTVSHARALAKGLTFRPLATTVKDTLDWWATLPPERQAKVRAGLSPEQEAAALALLKKG